MISESVNYITSVVACGRRWPDDKFDCIGNNIIQQRTSWCPS